MDKLGVLFNHKIWNANVGNNLKRKDSVYVKTTNTTIANINVENFVKTWDNGYKKWSNKCKIWQSESW